MIAMAQSPFPSGLYGITPENLSIEQLTQHVALACEHGLAALQWRRKDLNYEQHLAHAPAIRELCKKAGVLFIVNDSLKLALDLQADGVHLGKNDQAMVSARQELEQSGREMLIGVSCYNDLDRAARLIEAGADYIAFGAVYPSPTKPQAGRVSLETLAQARRMVDDLPQDIQHPAIVAIGGITTDNAAPVLSHGVNSLAVISGLFAPDGNLDTTRSNLQKFSQLFVQQG